jgi:glutamate racemase
MKPSEPPSDTNGILHWIVTDSGIGGLSICAEMERLLRLSGGHPPIRLTYFNAWPEPGSGYNSQPDVRRRASIFDCALTSMGQLQPDRIVIACNTLSILYEWTEFSRRTSIPVTGIIDAGVALFSQSLRTDPGATLIILGTRTTIESQTHRDRLISQGIAGKRIHGVACHGLAAEIEKDPESPVVAAAIDTCVCTEGLAAPTDGTVLVGLACTHYGYVKESIRRAFERRFGPRVRILDPNRSLAESTVASVSGEPSGAATAAGTIPVAVISKVELSEEQRRAAAKKVEPISAPTARALIAYTHQPDLF